MKTIIYYFSGTGNSLFIAKALKNLIPDTELIPIVQALRDKDYVIKADNIGFVFPTHGLTLPIPVNQFLKNMEVSSANYFFAVASRGGTIFRGFPIISSALKKQGKKLNASFIISMAANDPKLKFYHDPAKEELELLQKNALMQLEQVQKVISNREDYHMSDKSGVTFTKNSLLNYVLERIIPFMTHYISPKVKKYFYADSKCTGCGICEKVCLSEKIRMDGDKPVWQKNTTCYLCYSCLNYCPVRAVQIHSKVWMKSYTTKRGRYPHPFATVEDIASQK